MGFLERISCAFKLDKNNLNNSEKSQHSAIVSLIRQKISSNPIRVDFDKKYVTEVPSKEDLLALTNPVKFIKMYANKEVIENSLLKNPNIKSLLEEYNLPVEYCLDNVESIIMSHLVPTAKMTQKVYQKLGHSINEENYLFLIQAALLHDIGKVFIPADILNKRGKLTSTEREIIELHNLLSFEILKTTDLDTKVAVFAYEHHDYDKKVVRNDENQSLTVSDIYCALREKRSYKKPINDICAKAILYDMATNGKFDTKYIRYITA